MKDKSVKVFVDTNIWFSAFYGSPNCESILKAHINGHVQIVISKMVLAEIVKNLKDKILSSLPHFEKYFKASPAVVVKDSDKVDARVIQHVDKKDQAIFASALASECDYFVTGNTKDFDVNNLENNFKIKLVTPREFVKLLKN